MLFKTDPKSPIGERITVHDRYQFEAKIVYHVDPAQTDTAYEMEAYFFLPQSLHINPRTYSRNQFYRDIQSYIRFKTPSVELPALALGEDSPLARLGQSILALRENPGAVSIARFEYRLRLLCCIVKSCLRDRVTEFQEKIAPAQRPGVLAGHLRTLGQFLQKYRQLDPALRSALPDDSHLRLFEFGDEYLSLLAEDFCADLAQVLLQTPPSATSAEADMPRQLARFAAEEIAYRRAKEYPSIPVPGAANEEYVLRKATLKKYMGSVLFLNTRIERENQLLEQIVFAVAAGLAMLFATAVAFIYQYWYGVLTLPFFLALVVSYVFKDRIKELARVYLSSAARAYLFDHKTGIYAKKGEQIGYCRESFDFIAESKIHPAILELRNRDRISTLETGWLGENIIRYRKKIRIFSKKIQHLYRGALGEGITDILRLNISEFLHKMDDPLKEILLPAGQDFQKTSARRVYQINMIIAYHAAPLVNLERYRLVLSREGIERIELAESARIHPAAKSAASP